MSEQYLSNTPSGIQFKPDADDPASRMRPEDVQRIAEIFETPLQGAYNWDYDSSDAQIRRLYELGKKLNWNAQLDIDWSPPVLGRDESPMDEGMNPFEGFPPFEAMNDEERRAFGWHNYAWMLSQFMHGEQGALLVASQLCSCAPTYDAKLYAASQTFDEARHVETFSKYMRERVGLMYPVNPHLKLLMDKILTDSRWDLKFIGMQIIIEGLALAAFHTLRMMSHDPVFRELIDYVIRDEARHVAFGVTYLEQFVKGLPEEEKEARAEFSYEACIVMRERLIATEVHEHFGFDVDEARRYVLSASVMEEFRKLLFTRIIPNLKRVGLLTESIRPRYDELGLLEYENLVDDGVIDWAQLGEAGRGGRQEPPGGAGAST